MSSAVGNGYVFVSTHLLMVTLKSPHTLNLLLLLGTMTSGVAHSLLSIGSSIYTLLLHSRQLRFQGRL